MATTPEHTRAQEQTRAFTPAAGWTWALPFYDLIGKLFGGHRARRILLEDATLRPGQRVLDVGCGTGSLAVVTKRQHPDVEVVGVDPDPRAWPGRSARPSERGSRSSSIGDSRTNFRIP